MSTGPRRPSKNSGARKLPSEAAKSKLEETLALELKANKIPFQREYRFYPPRRWRYDFFIEPEDDGQVPVVVVDVQGGLYGRGKHTRPEGYANDAEKMFRAQLLGFVVIYATREMIESGRTVEMIKEALA